MSAVLDGEIICSDRHGRSNFYSLMFRRDWPHFYAFDVLSIDGENLRDWLLIERKRQLRAIMSASIPACSMSTTCGAAALSRFAPRARATSIVAKWRDGRYQSGSVCRRPG